MGVSSWQEWLFELQTLPKGCGLRSECETSIFCWMIVFSFSILFETHTHAHTPDTSSNHIANSFHVMQWSHASTATATVYKPSRNHHVRAIHEARCSDIRTLNCITPTRYTSLPLSVSSRDMIDANPICAASSTSARPELTRVLRNVTQPFSLSGSTCSTTSGSRSSPKESRRGNVMQKVLLPRNAMCLLLRREYSEVGRLRYLSTPRPGTSCRSRTRAIQKVLRLT